MGSLVHYLGRALPKEPIAVICKALLMHQACSTHPRPGIFRGNVQPGGPVADVKPLSHNVDVWDGGRRRRGRNQRARETATIRSANREYGDIKPLSPGRARVSLMRNHFAFFTEFS